MPDLAMSLVPSTRLADRIAALRVRLSDEDLEALLVTHQANIFYLSNVEASAGVLLVGKDSVSLIIDARYVAAVRALVEAESTCQGMVVVQVGSSYEETVLSALVKCGVGRVGIEADQMTVASCDWFEGALAGTGVRLCRTTGLVEAARMIKDSDELATMREAGTLISTVMDKVLRELQVGRREREVAADINSAIQNAGFDRPAFDTIVATGPNTAFPHARPSGRKLASGDLVLLDFGGVYNGYCVDLTRMASLGIPDTAAVSWHAAVSEAHAAAIGVVRPGVSASEVDAAARTVLEQQGFGAAFGHGTGHGLGIEVHEAPRVGKRRSEGALGADREDIEIKTGMVFTVEPGVYMPGYGGVRLEDDLIVTEDGHELLTGLALDLFVV